MYAVRREVIAKLGKNAQLLNLQQELGVRAEAAAGFRGRFLLASLGYPGKYVSLGFWDSRQQAQAFAQSVTALLAATPPDDLPDLVGLPQAYVVPRDTPGTEVMIRIGNPGAALLVDWEVDVPGQVQPFIDSRKHVFDAIQTSLAGNFMSAHLLQHEGQLTRFAAFHGRRDEAALTLNQAALQAIAPFGPASNYTRLPRVVDRFIVVV